MFLECGLFLFQISHEPDMIFLSADVVPEDGIDIKMNQPRRCLTLLADFLLEPVFDHRDLVTGCAGPVVMPQPVIKHGVDPGFLSADVGSSLIVNEGSQLRQGGQTPIDSTGILCPPGKMFCVL